ncbi:MAG: hypothetical protein F9K18_03890 [Thermoanaerobaculia bacterium]|nr:MAG: hypothetical protein F9K18_03890 [Thermoanaerobaculia bacterium]
MSRYPACLGFLFLAPFLPLAASAQVPGDLDPTFGTGGKTVVDIPVGGNPRNNSATGLLLQADGKVVMGGSASLIGAATGEERMVAVRLTAAGAPDASFGTGGIVRVDGLTGRTDEGYYDGRVALGADGGTYLFNGTQDSNGVIGWVVAKLTAANGALDAGWDGDGRLPNSGNTLEAGDIAALADGKVLVLDDHFDTGPNPDNQQMYLSRRSSAGALDTTFAGGTGVKTVNFDLGTTWNDYARVILVQSDGRILVAGRADTAGGGTPPADFALARLTPEGSFDPTFGGGDGKVTLSFDLPFGNVDEVRALAVDARGRIYAGGIAGNFSTANDCALVRLLPDGTPDASFSGDGKVTFSFAAPGVQSSFDQIFGLALQGDGRIVAVGRGTNAAGSGRTVGIARLTATGALDPTFAGDGTVVYQFASGTGSTSVGRAAVLAHDGSIVLSGFAQTAPNDGAFFAARLHNDYIFADGFESESTGAWSAAAP